MNFLTKEQLEKLTAQRLLALYKSRRTFPAFQPGDEYYDEHDEYVALIKSVLETKEHVEKK